MGRKLKPIFSKYEATTQTSLASTVYDGQPGDPVELHHVVYPRVKPIQPKGGKSKGRKAQSAHVPAPYKKSGAYSKFKVKSQKLKPAQVDGLIDRDNVECWCNCNLREARHWPTSITNI